MVLEEASDAVKIKSVCVYGGVPKYPQIQAIKQGVEVIVATPGRLIDLMNVSRLNLLKLWVKYLRMKSEVRFNFG